MLATNAGIALVQAFVAIEARGARLALVEMAQLLAKLPAED
jgi:hypothetical protein